MNLKKYKDIIFKIKIFIYIWNYLFKGGKYGLLFSFFKLWC